MHCFESIAELCLANSISQDIVPHAETIGSFEQHFGLPARREFFVCQIASQSNCVVIIAGRFAPLFKCFGAQDTALGNALKKSIPINCAHKKVQGYRAKRMNPSVWASQDEHLNTPQHFHSAIRAAIVQGFHFLISNSKP